ncbi:MAG: plastocyanin/azurin family copper-binding protein [Patescibacteria group bacterium]
MSKKILLLVALVLMFGVSGCGRPSNNDANGNIGDQNLNMILPDNTVRVRIKDSQFISKTAIIKAGMTVLWVNQDNVDHQIKSTTFSSPKLKPGDTFSYTFDNVGVYDYVCSLHPTMAGSISVQTQE